jgi:hypothetical protein
VGGAGLIAARSGLDGWVPYRVRAGEAPPRVDWCHLGTERFTAPFFTQTIDACLRKPFNQLFAHATPIDALLEAGRLQPGLAPTAFIFHCSRCGSTLYSQLAAALPETIAISEAPPIDHVLGAAAPDAERIDWLRALVGVLAQPRRADDRHVFVKFDAWHIASLTLVQRAFPGVPCLFLYRDPAEVLASQLRMPGIYMVPGVLDPKITRIDPGTLLALKPADRYARLLEWIFGEGLAHAEAGRVALVNYAELPAAAVRQLLDWCDLSRRDDLRLMLEHTSGFDAKTPSLPFLPGTGTIAAEAIRAATGGLTKLYERLEARRRAHL